MNGIPPYPGFVDYYQALQLDYPARPEEIKQAYRRMAREIHPDARPGGGPEDLAGFHKIQEAYSVLTRPDDREHYDFYYEQFRSGPDCGAGCGSCGCGPTLRLNRMKGYKRWMFTALMLLLMSAFLFLWVGRGLLAL